MSNQNFLQEKENDNLDIKFILQLLFRHKKLIILIVLISSLFTLYYTFTVAPSYKASTTLMIRESDNGSSNMLFDIIGNSKSTQIENEKLLIRSRVVSENTIKELWKSNRRENLNILQTREYIPRGRVKRKMLKEILTFGFYEEEKIKKNEIDSIYSDVLIRKYAEQLRYNLDVYNENNTDILTITYSSPFPDESSFILNQITDTYMEMDKNWSLNQANSILSFVEYQASSIEKNLSIAEEKLKGFKENEGIFDLSGNSELLLNQLISAEEKYYNTKAELSIAEERKKFLSSTLSNEEKTFANKLINSINPKLLALRTEISEKEVELVRNSTLHGDDHITVVKLKNEIDALKEKLDSQAETLIKQGLVVSDPVEYRQELITNLLVVESDLANHKAKENQYEKLVIRYNEQLSALPSLQLGYARLERDRAVLNSTYMLMREKLEESRIKVASVTGKIQIIDRAFPPRNKTSPNHKKNLFLGLCLGLIIGIVIVSIIEFFDSTIKSLDDINSNISILGIIPSMKTQMKSRSRSKNKLYNIISTNYFKERLEYYYDLFFRKSFLDGDNEKRHLITHEDPKSPISESYRSLRSSLLYINSDSKKLNNGFIVSSTGPGEGKTTTIANLAITYANLGKKVLLIDTDLRKPVLHKVFDLQNEIGVTNYLIGQENDHSKLVSKTEINNLDVITCGLIPPNPSELISSERMLSLYKTVQKEWDIILFDSPPLVAVTDASIISRIINNLVLVVMPGRTDKRAFSHCISNLENIDASPLGIIFNGVDSKNSYGSYYYYYQYYKYYGNEK